MAASVAPALVVGVDISEPMLAAARARAAATGCSNVEFRLHDVQDEPLEASSFDVAFSRFGVMFFPEPELGIPRMYITRSPTVAGWGSSVSRVRSTTR